MHFLRWRPSDFTINNLSSKLYVINHKSCNAWQPNLVLKYYYGKCYLCAKSGYSAEETNKTAVVELNNLSLGLGEFAN